ncbi:VWA domain-containing protein [Sungkyunkwania multivorans]|uniref:VWA domain-containing protein n=1 Tax=Sungkyunkwania multivorans TaxID=1173618 RepID=A0ABW3D221_9FLAO
MKNLKNILVMWSMFLLCSSLMACKNNDRSKEIDFVENASNQEALKNLHGPKTNKHFIKVALLLDTSNSMDGLINQAKAQLWEIVNELSYAKCGNDRPNLQIALYEYGNDNLPAREGYIRQVLGFSNDLDEISEKLFSLTTNGGNEFCGEVIETSLKQLDWGNDRDDLKLLFIAGNEPFTQGNVDYRDAIADAKEKDVVVNTIFCGDYDQGISGMWQDGAIRGDGDYMTINHNRAIVHVVTPYDAVILKLNSRLNKTYIAYGSRGIAKMELQSAQDTNAASMNEEVAVKRAVSKSSRLYNNSNWDLVDAIADKEIAIADLKEKDLPKELKGKSEKEIKSYIEEKRVERAKIQGEIQSLNTMRKQYIATKQKEESKDNLEAVMIQAIKKQAKRKNYSW